jgi:carbamoyl-phosphate synthase small subunit
MVGANLSEIVSTKKRYNYGKGLHKVAILDLGVKENTLKEFERVGFQSIVFPHNSSFEEIMRDSPDAFFISNGPGDPAAADGAVDLLQRVLSKKLPFFGICFGHQIFGRALGLNTTKLKFGHRGINQPVIDLHTKRVSITAHNHGFAVDSADSFDTPYGLGRVTHRCLNDDVVEGLALETQIAFSVQFHPEAAAGPHDSNSIFDQFANTVRSSGGKSA